MFRSLWNLLVLAVLAYVGWVLWKRWKRFAGGGGATPGATVPAGPATGLPWNVGASRAR